MTTQKGKDLLLKVDEADNGTFVTVAGIRSNRITFNAETVDATTADSVGQWRELLVGAGVRSVGISGAGLFTDADTDSFMREIFFNHSAPPFQVLVPELGTIEGAFQITSLEYAGTYDGELTVEITLASAGEISFTSF